jgi:hypothetical protein
VRAGVRKRVLAGTRLRGYALVTSQADPASASLRLGYSPPAGLGRVHNWSAMAKRQPIWRRFYNAPPEMRRKLFTWIPLLLAPGLVSLALGLVAAFGLSHAGWSFPPVAAVVVVTVVGVKRLLWLLVLRYARHVDARSSSESGQPT